MKPRSFVIELLATAHGGPLPVGALLRGLAVFGISENAGRVTIARLAAAGVIEPVGRGAYRLGPERQPVARHVLSWAERETQMVAWGGGWLGACATAGKIGAGERKQRAQALALLGYRELEPGLAVRPDNIVGGIAEQRRRFAGFGVEAVRLVSVGDVEEAPAALARRLWESERLEREYARMQGRVERLEAAARQAGGEGGSSRRILRDTFTIGGQALRLLSTDPLLPEAMADGSARRALLATAMRLEDTARPQWIEHLEVGPELDLRVQRWIRPQPWEPAPRY